MTMLSPCLLVYRAHLGNPDFFEILRGKLPDQLHDMWNQTFPETKVNFFIEHQGNITLIQGLNSIFRRNTFELIQQCPTIPMYNMNVYKNYKRVVQKSFTRKLPPKKSKPISTVDA